MSFVHAASVQAFIIKWSGSGAAERGNAHFEGTRTKKGFDEMTKLLETLAAVGRARKQKNQWIVTACGTP